MNSETTRVILTGIVIPLIFCGAVTCCLWANHHNILFFFEPTRPPLDEESALNGLTDNHELEGDLFDYTEAALASDELNLNDDHNSGDDQYISPSPMSAF